MPKRKPKRDGSNSHGMYVVMGKRSSPKAGRKKVKSEVPVFEEDRTSSPDGRISFEPVKYGS